MPRFLRKAVSSLTIVGYFFAVTWGPAWHDHHHGHCHHAHTGEQTQPAANQTPHVHACCPHHHACHSETHGEAEPTPAHSPCHAPLHDDDCVICQLFAHPPLPAPEIELVDAVEPLSECVILFSPQPASSPPAAYDSRGPPLV